MPYEQAIATALNAARRNRESGGRTGSDGLSGPKFHAGPIHSHVAGRTDHLPITVESGSYVLPADIVSAGGEGNTMAGFKVLRRTFGGHPYGASSKPYGQSTGPYGSPVSRASGGRTKAAGILFLSPEKEVLLLKRSGKDHHGEWGLPAGHVEKGERAEQAARRETQEEAGYDHDGGLSPFMHSDRDGVDFTTFLAHSQRFKPKLNDEHDDYRWVAPDRAETLSLHPGVRAALNKLRARKAHGGSSGGVPIVAAGGEHVLTPNEVRYAGGGDLDTGHRVLDQFVRRVRKELIATLQKLPGPKRD
jgi:8-oxo-dGTP pyrophosphatase MutT (NUDIX family)